MKSILLIILAILPTILISLYVYKKDKHKESLGILITLFCLGIFSAVAVIIISIITSQFIPIFNKETYQMNTIELLLSTFISVALTEELCKWIVVYFLGYRNKEFDETYDIIIYAIFTTLGFATFENILYVLDTNTIQIAVQRALFSIPAHTSYAIFMSYYLCLAKINRIKNDKAKEMDNLIKSIVFPTIIHGIFDFCLFADKAIYLTLFYFFTGVLFILAFQKLKESYKINASLKDIKRVCDKCGSVFYGDICQECHTKNVKYNK